MIWSREKSAGEIAKQFDVTFGAISQHLAILRDAGLVEQRKEGRQRFGIPSISARDAHQQSWNHYVSRIRTLAVGANLASALGPTIENDFNAWTEPDASKRLSFLESCWDENGAFADSMGSIAGRAALASYIGAALQYAAGARLESAGSPQQMREYVRFDRRIVSGDQTFGTGTNFGKLNADGRFESIVGFWNPPSS